jgi:hypothetical protein
MPRSIHEHAPLLSWALRELHGHTPHEGKRRGFFLNPRLRSHEAMHKLEILYMRAHTLLRAIGCCIRHLFHFKRLSPELAAYALIDSMKGKTDANST